MFLHPPFAVFEKIGEKIESEGLVRVCQVDLPEGIRQPATVSFGLRAIGPEPIAHEVPRHPWGTQPAHLPRDVPGGADDRPVGPRPRRTVGEFGKGVAVFRRTVNQVFGDDFPTVVPGRVDLCIRRLQHGDVLREPRPVAIVPEGLFFQSPLFVQHSPVRIAGFLRDCGNYEERGKD